MTYQDLRKQYPKFIYDRFEYDFVDSNLEIKFYYSIPPDHKFVHKLIIKNCSSNNENLENLIFHVGLSLMPSYWKSTCSPSIEIQAGHLSPKQLAFWHKLFIKGMGEYFYKNQIDFRPKDFLTITSINITPHPPLNLRGGTKEGDIKKVIVPIGGGKDSIVTLELLKPHFEIIPFIVNPVPIMYEVINTARISKYIVIESHIDPYLLELNKQGYLNGHIPLSAFYAFASLLSAQLSNSGNIAFSNERSSNEGNTTYLGQEINHQYSKSLEFESDFNIYLKLLSIPINYFSFLRPLYELQIAKIFSQYEQYFKVFFSCNRNFTIDPKDHPHGLWCGKCPKCVSTSLMLACFIGKKKVSDIMGSYPPDQQYNNETIQQLLGNLPVKPFECVLTRAEAQAAYEAVELRKLDNLNEILASWMDNPNMPKEFEKILKNSITPPSPS